MADSSSRRKRPRFTIPRNFRVIFGLLLSLGILFGAVVWAVGYTSPRPDGSELTIDQLYQLIGDRRVDEANFLDEDAIIQGTYVSEPVFKTAAELAAEQAELDAEAAAAEAAAAAAATEGGEPPAEEPTAEPTEETVPDDQQVGPRSTAPEGAGKFWVSYPKSDTATAPLIDQLSTAGAQITVDHQTPKGVVRLLLTVLLPLMILANLFALFLVLSKGNSGGLGEVTDFSTLKSGRKNPGVTPITFSDIAGVEDAVDELNEIVDYLKHPERYEQFGAVAPKGVLLFGPPGTGKTLMAKAIAGEAGVPFFSVAGAQFVEALVGVGAARVRDLFERVREASPAILFIDEIDAAGRRRGSGSGGGGSDEREQTLNQLLVEMDGFDTASGIVVIGATNRPDILDPALLRPGRFDRHVHIQPPDIDAREAILKLHAVKRPLGRDVDLCELARQTPGFTGADLANVLNEGALLTVRRGGQVVGQKELNEAVLRVIGGTSSRGHLMTENERHRVAVHESGHAIVAGALGRGRHIHRVSIVGHGGAAGRTRLAGSDDHVALSRTRLIEDLTVQMGGRAAELLVLGEPSTAGEDDLRVATDLARDLTARFGMSESLGVRRLLGPATDKHLGVEEDFAPMSEELHAELDREITAFLLAGQVAATALLKIHQSELLALVEVLSEVETIEGAELYELLPQSSNGKAAAIVARASGGPVVKTATRKSPTRKAATTKAATATKKAATTSKTTSKTGSGKPSGKGSR